MKHNYSDQVERWFLLWHWRGRFLPREGLEASGVHHTSSARSAALGMLLAIALALLSQPGMAGDVPATLKVSSAQDDAAACKANLNRIYEALLEYQRVHTNLPNYFSDLHPDFIADPRLFICPAALRAGDYFSGRAGLRSDVFEDVLPTTYSYEFNIKPYPLWAGIESTEREYKERQMKVLGPDVAVVRCFVEGHKICLSLVGTIFDSPSLDWEDYYANRVPMARLLPSGVFKDLAPVPGRPHFPTPSRDSNTDPRLIDLSNFYVASLDKPWVWRNPPQNNVSALPRGVVKLDAVPVSFDIRGIIQLIQVVSNKVSAPFPSQVDGIPIRQKCQRIHFLQGAYNSVPDGTEIGHYQVHYTDGRQARIPIVYGRDVLTAWQRRATTSLTPRVAWAHGEAGNSLRTLLYHQAWTNASPEATIDSLDFVSAMTRSAPFLIAITLEP